jgi:predicted RNA-binding protein associated with RNAse of E/G family
MYNQNYMNTVTIHHIRPGKRTEIFTEGFVSEDQHGLATLSILSDEDSKSMSERLRSHGFIEAGDIVHSVAKYYSYSEYFNLLVFGGPNGEAIGYYSDMAMPLRKVDDGYEIVDLFLDIWLKPNGTLLELDLDEFQEAITRELITKEQQEFALTAFERLKNETRQGMYPQNYIRKGKG